MITDFNESKVGKQGTYIETNKYAPICITIAPSPPDFVLLTQRAQNQFSWIEVTKSANHNHQSQILATMKTLQV